MEVCLDLKILKFKRNITTYPYTPGLVATRIPEASPPPFPIWWTMPRYPQSELESPEADKNHTSRISAIENLSSFIIVRDASNIYKVTIENATRQTNEK